MCLVQVRKVPRAVQEERAKLAEEANSARFKKRLQRLGEKTKMKGKNKPSKKHRKKQLTIIEERKVRPCFRVLQWNAGLRSVSHKLCGCQRCPVEGSFHLPLGVMGVICMLYFCIN